MYHHFYILGDSFISKEKNELVHELFFYRKSSSYVGCVTCKHALSLSFLLSDALDEEDEEQEPDVE